MSVEAGSEGGASEDDRRDSLLLDLRDRGGKAPKLQLVAIPRPPIRAGDPVGERIIDLRCGKPRVQQRQHAERAQVEEIEVEGLQLAPATLDIVVPEHEAKECFLLLRRPERAEERTSAHAFSVSGPESPAAARRRSSAAFRTCKYCDRESRSRRPLFWV